MSIKNTKYVIVIVTYNRKQLLQECLQKVNRQKISPESIIIVNNASTDGTTEYLLEMSNNNFCYDVINLEENIGGAGGFAKGIERSMSKDAECVLIIDDDAMIKEDYMELLLSARKEHSQYKAFAGVVKVNGVIDTFHRKNMSKHGLLQRDIPVEMYEKDNFECEIASFCGMLVDMDVIKEIGSPHAEYFIWHDDAEYSLRINRYTKFLVIPDAILNHKTKLNNIVKPRRYDWREYYAIRNRILMVNEHGTLLDRMINKTDLFCRVIVRNWLFKVIKRGGYNWSYENTIVKRAVKNAKSNQLENVIIKETYI